MEKGLIREINSIFNDVVGAFNDIGSAMERLEQLAREHGIADQIDFLKEADGGTIQKET